MDSTGNQALSALEIISLLISVIGWFVVHFLGVRRTEVLEKKATARELKSNLDEIELSAFIYLTSTPDREGRERLHTLNHHIQRFTRRVSENHQTNSETLKRKIIELKRLCTGGDAESADRQALQNDDVRLENISRLIAEINDDIVRKF